MGEGEGELSPFFASIFPFSPETPNTQAIACIASVSARVRRESWD